MNTIPTHVTSYLEELVARTLNRAVRLHTGEVALVVHGLWWGVWAWRSIYTDKQTGFSLLSTFAPEWFLGSVSIVLALTCIASHWLCRPLLLRKALMAAFAWSAFLAGCFYLLNPYYSAVPTYGTLAVVYGFAYWKERTRGGR